MMSSTERARIFYKDIGDYLPREEKLKIISETRSILNPALQMVELKPNEYGDWLNKRNDLFETFIPLEPDKKFNIAAQSFFSTYAIGVATNRDAWVYNFSEYSIRDNMHKMIDFYNEQCKLFADKKTENQQVKIDSSIDADPNKISWSRALKNDASNAIKYEYQDSSLTRSLYRPFCVQNLYFHLPFIECPGIHSKLFPMSDMNNLLICVSGIGSNKAFSTIISNIIPDYNLFNTQCFPLYWYEKKEYAQGGLFKQSRDEYIRHDAITDFILEQARTRYAAPRVSKEDIFYYVYGLLHSPEYRETFANDLKKTLPRLPLVEKAQDFWIFSKAGRELADLHLNYEGQPPLEEVNVYGAEFDNFSVKKMTFPTKVQKDTIIYNERITISGIPAKAYEYIVNGKSAIEWVMERYAVNTHKESGIKNDPNDWSAEHGAPRYILDLLLSVISVSVKTVDMVNGLPQRVLPA
jgi:predicted helicase